MRPAVTDKLEPFSYNISRETRDQKKVVSTLLFLLEWTSIFGMGVHHYVVLLFSRVRRYCTYYCNIQCYWQSMKRAWITTFLCTYSSIFPTWELQYIWIKYSSPWLLLSHVFIQLATLSMCLLLNLLFRFWLLLFYKDNKFHWTFKQLFSLFLFIENSVLFRWLQWWLTMSEVHHWFLINSINGSASGTD